MSWVSMAFAAECAAITFFDVVVELEKRFPQPIAEVLAANWTVQVLMPEDE